MSNGTDQYVLPDDDPAVVAAAEWTLPADIEDVPTTAAGDEPALGEVLQVVFDIGVGERETYHALIGREYSRAGELADELGRDRSNVNRYLNELSEKGIVTRRRRILKSGGHVYQYSARPPEEVRALLLVGLSEWVGTARDHIDEFVAEVSRPERSASVESVDTARP